MRYRVNIVVTSTIITLATAGIAAGQEVRVMTRNLFIGADLGPVLAARTPAEFITAAHMTLAVIAASDFPQRAELLAQEISSKRPHLVGLQEVTRLTRNGTTGEAPYRDYLEDLLSALAARGADYYVAGAVDNLDVTLPLPGIGLVRTLDRDVVLARADVPAVPVTVPGCRVSADGCNFLTLVSVPTPFGSSIAIERGFLVVDAVAEGQPVRFVNTHLEIPELPVIVQSLQAAELMTRVRTLPVGSDTPVILVGDINSAPTDTPAVVGGATVIPPYMQLAASYADVWILRPGEPPGFTCCTTSLSSPQFQAFKRIDVIFAGGLALTARAMNVGADEQTATGLWASDHLGVFGRLEFAR
jgi:endonuclease/exonuclease/phosphatase family metal-dependent hydrolase